MLLGMTCAGVASAEYQVHELTVSGATSVALWGINNAGQMAGSAMIDGVSRGFVFDHGALTMVAGPAGSRAVEVHGISDGGKMIVSYEDENSRTHSYIDDHGVVSEYQLPFASRAVALRSISADGRYVTGFYADGAVTRAFVDDLTGGTGLHVIPSTGLSSIPGEINASGLVVGGRDSSATQAKDPFVFSVLDDSIRDEPFNDWVPVGSPIYRGINDAGVIAGSVFYGTGTVSFVGISGSFELLKVDRANATYAQAVNNAGVVVGHFGTRDGQAGAFYATPVPEPASGALAIAGLLLLRSAVGSRRSTRRAA